MKALEKMCVVLGSVALLLLLVAAWQQWVKLDLLETWGFVTGAVCVYLVVRQNIWNFPIGIANNLFLLVLLYQARLFGDAALQVVYLYLGALGWLQWLYGGNNGAVLRVRRASREILGLCVVGICAGTFVLMQFLQILKGAAPFLDALTTAISLAAQVLLNFKFLETWWFWIVADIFYIYLYFSRDLPLTAVLYATYIGLCVTGYAQWRHSFDQQNSPQPSLETQTS